MAQEYVTVTEWGDRWQFIKNKFKDFFFPIYFCEGWRYPWMLS